MTLEHNEVIEAVILFSEGEITRELLYPEFEAVLDGFVPMADFAGQSAKAVYVTINAHYCITAAAFFFLDFDGKGMIDPRWNLPLQQLVDVSGQGPDLGAGAIRLACYSQCGIAWLQHHLWDPEMDAETTSFMQLSRAVKNNRMGLVFKKSVVTDAVISSVQDELIQPDSLKQSLHELYSKEVKDQVAVAIKEQRLRIATLHSRQQEIIYTMRREHQVRIQSYRERIKSLEEKNTDLRRRNELLKEALDVQAGKVEGIREYFSHKLKAAQLDEKHQLALMHEQITAELDLRVQAATAELREMLEMREVELFYRYESESSLKDEVVRLKNNYQELLKNTNGQLLQRLQNAGVNFVVYHAGVGQFNIALDDVSQYLENPARYLASYLGVTEPLYLKWLVHYEHPQCNHLDRSGKLCAKDLIRIAAPLEFHEGESDRCENHQAALTPLVAETC